MKKTSILLAITIIITILFVAAAYAAMPSDQVPETALQQADLNLEYLGLQPALDTDGDGIPDVTDPDDDNDGLQDEYDNCQYVPNSAIGPYDPDNPFEQADKDDDGVGDACDNCIDDPNPDQNDADDNDVGDACDIDDSDDDSGDDDTDLPDSGDDDSGDDDEVLDTDGDGLFDYEDDCPTEFGSDENFGCPDVDVDPTLLGTPDFTAGFHEGGCALAQIGGTLNPFGILLIAVGLLQIVAIRRKK